jgi:hypothetical protein
MGIKMSRKKKNRLLGRRLVELWRLIMRVIVNSMEKYHMDLIIRI